MFLISLSSKLWLCLNHSGQQRGGSLPSSHSQRVGALSRILTPSHFANYQHFNILGKTEASHFMWRMFPSKGWTLQSPRQKKTISIYPILPLNVESHPICFANSWKRCWFGINWFPLCVDWCGNVVQLSRYISTISTISTRTWTVLPVSGVVPSKVSTISNMFLAALLARSLADMSHSGDSQSILCASTVGQNICTVCIHCFVIITLIINNQVTIVLTDDKNSFIPWFCELDLGVQPFSFWEGCSFVIMNKDTKTVGLRLGGYVLICPAQLFYRLVVAPGLLWMLTPRTFGTYIEYSS